MALHSLVQHLVANPVDRGEVALENDSMTAQDQDAASDVFDGDSRS
jgi:hypothetical protein